ncbi:hypothetical protein K503DRAFT_857344 [Rhizopogon vinicolor AM-OR11-026]|uniref:Uncharacterized protein n=1 Tax=Rhizopogon vinicolor AM-OR11-026 TaxID=1314800 RepID=A0A1B7MXY8_9AGAM|nr:hypothetical protein K503DRAFT_857344 [Rhizopogon vinicolor AM-OR11-026]
MAVQASGTHKTRCRSLLSGHPAWLTNSNDVQDDYYYTHATAAQQFHNSENEPESDSLTTSTRSRDMVKVMYLAKGSRGDAEEQVIAREEGIKLRKDDLRFREDLNIQQDELDVREQRLRVQEQELEERIRHL